MQKKGKKGLSKKEGCSQSRNGWVKIQHASGPLRCATKSVNAATKKGTWLASGDARSEGAKVGGMPQAREAGRLRSMRALVLPCTDGSNPIQD